MFRCIVCRPEQALRSSGKLLLLACSLAFTFNGESAAANQSPRPKEPARAAAEAANPSTTHPFAEHQQNQPHLPGDYNHDGRVDGKDLEQWQDDFSKSSDSDADLDGDSDGRDFLAWQRFFGTGNSVPEPSTVGLLLFPTLYHLGFRRLR